VSGCQSFVRCDEGAQFPWHRSSSFTAATRRFRHRTGLGKSSSRWSEWVAELSVGTQVPEPSNWAMMIAGFGLLGATMRRRRTDALT
jgi:hypothetical protein